MTPCFSALPHRLSVTHRPPRARPLQITLCALVLNALSSQVALADPALDQAQELLFRGQAAQAFEHLAPLEPEQAGSPDFDAALGQAAFAAGHYTRAIMAWERVVAAQPDNGLVRHQLLRALRAVGDRPAATALATSLGLPPWQPDATRTDDAFFVSFDAVEHAGQSTLHGSVDMAVGRDTNANMGPSDASLSGVLADGVTPWVLAPGASAQRASFWQVGAAVSGRHVLSPQASLFGQVSQLRRNYQSPVDNLDRNTTDAQMGVAWLEGRHDLSASWRFSGESERAQTTRRAQGLEFNWVYRLDGHRQWASFAQLMRLTYPAQPERDADRTVLGTTYMHRSPLGHLAYVGAYVGREQARNSNGAPYGHDLQGLRAGYQHAIRHDLSAYVSVLHENRSHGTADPLFALARHDRQTEAAVGLHWVPADHWRLTTAWSSTRNASNMPFLTYRRQQFSLSLRREF